MEHTAKIFIAGHRGMVGSALVRKFRKEGFLNIITRTSTELDLRDQLAVRVFFEKERPDYVILSAAKVGGIHANSTFRAEFIYDNLMIESNVIHASYLYNVKKLLFLGSSCIYPKLAAQPIKEEYLLSGFLETSNQPYAIAKIAGIEMCDSYRLQYGCNFISAMPTNLYGTNDNYHPENSHVIPGLIRRISKAKIEREEFVEVWGSGTPFREFLHVDDLADACYFLFMKYNENGHVNVGSGSEISIKNLAELIADELKYRGNIVFDQTKPDGTPRKLLDVNKLNSMGWTPKIGLREGLSRTIKEFFESNEVYH